MGQEPAQKRDDRQKRETRPEQSEPRDVERQARHIQRKLERQERHARRKREAILTAASQVFGQKGFASATTKDIANVADIGESTLYDYFDSKRDILLAMVFQNHEIFDAMFLEAGALPNREAFVELVSRCLDYAASRLLFSRTLLIEAMTDDEILQKHVWPRMRHVGDLVQNFLAAQIAANKIRPIDTALAARLMMGMFFAAVIPAMRGLEPPPTPEQSRALAETMVSLVLDGLSVREKESV